MSDCGHRPDALRHGPARDSCRRASRRSVAPCPRPAPARPARSRPRTACRCLSSRMLPGLMSRWTSPCLWAWCNASATVATSSTAFVQRQPGLLEPRGEVGAVDVLRDDEAGELLGAADIEDGNDVRVVEVGDGAGFGQVGFGVFGAGDQLAMRHLDGDRPLQLVVVGQVDQAEAALAQEPFDPIATDVGGHGGPSPGVEGLPGVFGGRQERIGRFVQVGGPSTAPGERNPGVSGVPQHPAGMVVDSLSQYRACQRMSTNDYFDSRPSPRPRQSGPIHDSTSSGRAERRKIERAREPRGRRWHTVADGMRMRPWRWPWRRGRPFGKLPRPPASVNGQRLVGGRNQTSGAGSTRCGRT